jgi:hypothetical protein
MPGTRSLTDRLVARALALAIDPDTATGESAARLERLANGNHDALGRALKRIEWGHPDPADPIAAAAVRALRLASSACTCGRHSATIHRIDLT